MLRARRLLALELASAARRRRRPAYHICRRPRALPLPLPAYCAGLGRGGLPPSRRAAKGRLALFDSVLPKRPSYAFLVSGRGWQAQVHTRRRPGRRLPSWVVTRAPRLLAQEPAAAARACSPASGGDSLRCGRGTLADYSEESTHRGLELLVRHDFTIFVKEVKPGGSNRTLFCFEFCKFPCPSSLVLAHGAPRGSHRVCSLSALSPQRVLWGLRPPFPF